MVRHHNGTEHGSRQAVPDAYHDGLARLLTPIPSHLDLVHCAAHSPGWP